MSRPHKLTPRERALAVKRYRLGLRHRPSVICAELKIGPETLRSYVLAALRGAKEIV
jgi:DNA-binding CsgD family transcriptional regulator